MNRKSIPIIVLSALLCSIFGCKEDDTIGPRQRTDIENYLSRQSAPYHIIAGAYRYITPQTDSENSQRTLLERGDSLSFYFEAYTFTTGPGTLFYTNRREIAEQQQNLDTSYWTFFPKRVILGNGAILKPIEDALTGCREGDSVVFLLPYDVGFGDKDLGIVEKNSALMYLIKIDHVKKL